MASGIKHRATGISSIWNKQSFSVQCKIIHSNHIPPYLAFTVCPRSSDQFHIVAFYINLVTTSWTDGILEDNGPIRSVELRYAYLLTSVFQNLQYVKYLPHRRNNNSKQKITEDSKLKKNIQNPRHRLIQSHIFKGSCWWSAYFKFNLEILILKT